MHFRDVSGEKMTDLVTSAQMRAIEHAAIESGSVTGLDLMERAGAGVVAAVLDQWPALAAGGHAVVLCGPGNNGGDGFVVARLLHDRGWRVSVFLYGDPARLPGDARHNHDRWIRLGTVRPLEDPQGGVYGGFGAAAPDLIVDALFGIGLTRDLPGDVDQALIDITSWMHRHGRWVPVVAVDIPSGLCADSGALRGCELAAGLTVTFHGAKPGHYLGEGPERCGVLRVVDIGLPQRAPGQRRDPAIAQRVTSASVRPLVAKPGGHKYDHGHALILAGGVGRGGAARMAARAALRIGAGLVTMGVPPPALQENAARLDAVMLRAVAGPEALIASLSDTRIAALCLGPGLGLDRARDLVLAALGVRAGGLRLVLDADALSVFADAPATLFAALTAGCVLTPHAGEFARLFPDLSERLARTPGEGPAWSKLDAVRAAAARAGCVVLLKGADTVIAAPDGRAAVNAAAYERAVPWLATAGAGDVLAGLIAGLLARGVAPFEAAQAGAWLHAEAARDFGPGLIAEDLPEAIPRVLAGLLRDR